MSGTIDDVDVANLEAFVDTFYQWEAAPSKVKVGAIVYYLTRRLDWQYVVSTDVEKAFSFIGEPLNVSVFELFTADDDNYVQRNGGYILSRKFRSFIEGVRDSTTDAADEDTKSGHSLSSGLTASTTPSGTPEEETTSSKAGSDDVVDGKAATISELIAIGESSRVEFKSSARWDYIQNKTIKERELDVIRAVAGFLNADGGTLLIGIDDKGRTTFMSGTVTALKN